MFHNAFDIDRVGFAASIAVVLDGHHHRASRCVIGRLSRRDGVTGRLDRYTTYVVLIGFSLLAIYPMLSILFLAFHKKSDLVTGFSLPTTFSLQTFIDAWNEGDFAQGMWGSFLVADDGHRRLGGALAVHRLRVRDDALPRLGRCSST